MQACISARANKQRAWRTAALKYEGFDLSLIICDKYKIQFAYSSSSEVKQNQFPFLTAVV
jgi:hypothetical protein